MGKMNYGKCGWRSLDRKNEPTCQDQAVSNYGCERHLRENLARWFGKYGGVPERICVESNQVQQLISLAYQIHMEYLLDARATVAYMLHEACRRPE